jgi:hypothetical protein
MNCEQAKEIMADSLTGAPGTGLDEHIAACAGCRAEWDKVQAAWQRMGAWPDTEPHPHVRVRFHEMLDAYQQGVRSRESRSWWPLKPVLQVAVALGCLAIGFIVGGRSTPEKSGEVSDLRKEMADMRQLVTLSLLQQQSATDRLRGVTWSYRTEPSDTEVLGALLTTIKSDPDVNVRLAAIDAIRNFTASPVARRGLVQSLPRQSSPLVQIAVIDLLAELKERDAAPFITSALENPDLDPTVRQRFQAALQSLR